MLKSALLLLPCLLAALLFGYTMPNPIGNGGANCGCSRQADSTYLIDGFANLAQVPIAGLTGWNASTPLDQWEGVTLDAGDNCIQHLELPGVGLTGVLPTDMDQLCGLEVLNLSSNGFAGFGGALNPSLGNLSNLRELNLSGNDFMGTIPAEFGDLGALEILILSNNPLGTTIPPELGNLQNLFDLRLDNCDLIGGIPTELGNCPNLFRFWIQNNNLTGNIPPSLANTSLQIFFANNNQLEGCLPNEFSTIPINQLEINDNMISCMPPLANATVGKVEVQNNKLTFDDILPNIQYFENCNEYFQQDSIGEALNVLVPAGSRFVIDLGIDSLIATNKYEWRKDGLGYASIDSLNKLIFPDIGFADAGTYFATITNDSAPCLTLASRPVTINIVCATETETLDTVLCAGESVEINGTLYGEGGPLTGSEFFPSGNRHGCDSIFEINIELLSEATGIVDTTLCPGDTILVNNTAYHQGNFNGTEILPNGSSRGCDSTITVSLSFFEIDRDTQLVEICRGDFHSFGGENLDSSGFYADTLTGSDGCDSISVLELVVHPTYRDTLPFQICEGQSLTYNGQVYDAEGTFFQPFSSVKGCDSLVQIEVTVADVFFTPLEAAICEGDTTFVGTRPVFATGIHRDTLSSTSGCDSILELNLTVHPVILTPIDTAICAGDSLFFGGSYRDTVGTWLDTLSAVTGCDSIVQLNLDLLPIPVTELDTSLCAGQALYYADDTLAESGQFEYKFTAANGCDSLVRWDILIRDTFFTQIQDTICENETYLFQGQTLDTAGVYSIVLTAGNGCDSTVVLALTVNDTIHVFVQDSICQGETYAFNGQLLSDTGQYTGVFSTSQGCDSVVHLSLGYKTQDEILIEAAICEGDSFLFEGNWYQEAGTYRDTLMGTNGCDSIRILQLDLLPHAFTFLEDTICANESLFFGGSERNQTGVYVDSLVAANGCDSVVTLTLEVLELPFTFLEITICDNEQYVFGTDTLSQAGTYYDTLPAANGCDSLVELALTVLPTYFTPLQATICEGDTLNFEGRPLTDSGIYLDTLSALNGCDSILEMTLEVRPVFFTPLTDSICANDSLWFGDRYLNQSGTYRDTLLAQNGCDSVLELELTVLALAFTTVEASICEGQGFLFNGNTYVDEGTFEVLLTAANGCDSLVTLNLEVRPNAYTLLQDTFCSGDTYLFGGQLLEEEGVYRDTLLAQNGCDSVVELNLEQLTPQEQGLAEAGAGFTLCMDTALLQAEMPAPGVSGVWTYLGGGNAQILQPLQPNTLVANLLPGEQGFIWTLSSSQCTNYDRDTVWVQKEGAPVAIPDAGFLPHSQDSLVLDILDNDGFLGVSAFEWQILVQPGLGSAAPIQGGQLLQYNGPHVEAQTSLTYELCNLLCPTLCDTTEVLITLEEEPLPEELDIPNAFTPNGDGKNDTWYIEDLERYSLIYPENEMVIFNRWGNVLFQSQPYQNNWDGRDQGSGQDLPEGTYYYIFRLNSADGQVYKGDITILR